ncbi:MAG: sortase [Patescibacteria group bacterium]
MLKRGLLVLFLVLLVSLSTPTVTGLEEVDSSTLKIEKKESDGVHTGYVTFWFDDGYKSTFEKAYPLLEEKDWSAVVAVVTNLTDASSKFLGIDELMSFNDIESLYNSGWEISSHSSEHLEPSEITELATAEEEVLGSKETLKSLGFEVGTYTLPYGESGYEVYQILVENNYYRWRSLSEGINTVPSGRKLYSYSFPKDINWENIDEIIDQTMEKKGWLIITLHATVDNPASHWDHTPSQLEELIEKVDDSGLRVVTPSQMESSFLIPSDFSENTITLAVSSINVESQLLLVEQSLNSNSEYWGDFSSHLSGPMWLPTRAIGETGLTLILGHRQWGSEPMVFADLDDLQVGDSVNIRVDGEDKYVFTVTDIQVIEPEDLWSFYSNRDEECERTGRSCLSLITCTPYGTDKQRLVVTAVLNK